jgi:hypothetical protein
MEHVASIAHELAATRPHELQLPFPPLEAARGLEDKLYERGVLRAAPNLDVHPAPRTRPGWQLDRRMNGQCDHRDIPGFESGVPTASRL